MRVHLTTKQWGRAKKRLPKSVIIAKAKSRKPRFVSRVKASTVAQKP